MGVSTEEAGMVENFVRFISDFNVIETKLGNGAIVHSLNCRYTKKRNIKY